MVGKRIRMNSNKRTYLLSCDGCPACGTLKRRLAGKIKSGKIGVINLSSERNFFLTKELGIRFVPEIVTVSKSDNGVFNIQREDGKVCELTSWRWWKKPRGGSPRSTNLTRK